MSRSLSPAALFYTGSSTQTLYAVQRTGAGTRTLLAHPVSALLGQTSEGLLIVAERQGDTTIIASLRSDGTSVRQIATISGTLERARLSPYSAEQID